MDVNFHMGVYGVCHRTVVGARGGANHLVIACSLRVEGKGRSGHIGGVRAIHLPGNGVIAAATVMEYGRVGHLLGGSAANGHSVE